MRRLALLVAAAIALGLGIRLAMPAAGKALIVSDPLRHSDSIVVLASNNMDRVAEAAILYREGWSRRILLSHPDESFERASQRRIGISIPTDYDIHRSVLRQMGVPDTAVEDLPGHPESTEDEAALIADASRSQGLKTILVVTSPYHSRRARMYLSPLARNGVTVVVRSSRFDSVAPAQWWRRQNDRTNVVLELLKLPKCFWSVAVTRLRRLP